MNRIHRFRSFLLGVLILLSISQLNGFAEDRPNAPTASTTDLLVSALTTIGITPDQEKRIREQVSVRASYVEETTKRMSQLKGDIAAALSVSSLDENMILSKQNELNQLTEQFDAGGIKTMMAVRHILTPAQLDKFFYGNADMGFLGVSLSQAQKDQYRQLMKGKTNDKLVRTRLRTPLEQEKTALLKHSVLDTQQLLSVQRQLNKLSDEESLADVQFQIDSYNILTTEQKKVAAATKRPKVWDEAGVTADQDKKMMELSTKIQQVDDSSNNRIALLGDQLHSMFFDPNVTEDQLLSLQKQADDVKAQAANEELNYFVESTKVLTPEQRQRLVELVKANQSQPR